MMRKVEHELRSDLSKLGHLPKEFEFPHLELSSAAYFQRNFFSILFVSIYQSLGIPEQRIQHYAKILHLIRGIVTCTDNILDHENKGAIRVKLGKGEVLPQILSLLIQQGQWFSSLRQLTQDERQLKQCYGALIDALWALGAEEAEEEGEVRCIITPQEIIESIHEFRGARLLLLAFVVPEQLEIESTIQAPLKLAMSGVKKIGLALQILDDVCDLEMDLKVANHNYLLSRIVHSDSGEGARPVNWDRDLVRLQLIDHGGDVSKAFTSATWKTLQVALEYAFAGFELLHQSGHPLDSDGAKKMLQTMFELRGLKSLWDFAQLPQPTVQWEEAPAPSIGPGH